MKASKYLDQFGALGAVKESFSLIGDFLVVERIPEAELVTKSGLILSTPRNQHTTFSTNRPHWVRVLYVGEGYYDQETDENGKIVERTIPLEANPGDIILVAQESVKYFSVFGDLEGYEADTIGLTKAAEIQLRFKGEEGYRRAFASLNGAAKKEVEPGPAQG